MGGRAHRIPHRNPQSPGVEYAQAICGVGLKRYGPPWAVLVSHELWTGPEFLRKPAEVGNTPKIGPYLLLGARDGRPWT